MECHLNATHYASTKTKLRASGIDLFFEILFNYIIGWILGHVLQRIPRVQADTNAHGTDLACGDDIA